MDQTCGARPVPPKLLRASRQLVGIRFRCDRPVLAAQGKAFCAGADFSDPKRQKQESSAQKDPAANLPINYLYVQAVRIFRNKKPIVAAVHGAAIGDGLGLAVSADFRVTCPEARFAANFTKLGFHPGFGLTGRFPNWSARTTPS